MRKTFQVLEAGDECLGIEFGELESQSFDLSTLGEDLDQNRRNRLGIKDEVWRASVAGPAYGRDGEPPNVLMVFLGNVGGIRLHSLKVWQFNGLSAQMHEATSIYSNDANLHAIWLGRRRRKRLD